MQQKIRIEDNFDDVLKKAAAGLGLSALFLAERAGLAVAAVEAVLSGGFDRDIAWNLAEVLDLDPEALVAMAKGEWYPELDLPECLFAFNTPCPIPGYAEMTVNSYLVALPGGVDAVAFDSGASAKPMLSHIRKQGLRLRAVFLTHTHWDHVAALDELCQATEYPPIYCPVDEPVAGAQSVRAGDGFEIAGLCIEARATPGHSPGGTTYRLENLSSPVAVVGDSLFCLSQGGAPKAYKQALESNRREILSLPPETALCPGHGPITSVSEERARNPFFPDLKDPK